MASGGVSSLAQLDERASGGNAGGGDEHAGEVQTCGPSTASTETPPPQIAPLYKRLPHGPHRLGRDAILQNQRARIHGAMIEAVAQYGYQKTSVKKIVALAGVSRRSFYEQFANKEQCFLTSLDLIAARAVQQTNEAYRAADGDLEDRLRAAFEQFTKEVGGSGSKGASLVIVQAPALGAASLPHLCRATATFEQMLLSSFAHALKRRLPFLCPIVRGIVGGPTRGDLDTPAQRPRQGDPRPDRGDAAAGRCSSRPPRPRHGRAPGRARSRQHTLHKRTYDKRLLHERLFLKWTLRKRTLNANGHTANGYATNGNDHLNGDAPHRTFASACSSPRCGSPCSRTTKSSARHRSPTKQESQSTPSSSCSSTSKSASRLPSTRWAIELLKITADPELVADDWPRAVRQAIGALMHHLAAHPLHAQMIATGAYAAGPDAIERNYELAQEIATLLTEGAPERPTSISRGGCRGRDLAHRPLPGRRRADPLLPALTDYLTYVVLDAVHRRRGRQGMTAESSLEPEGPADADAVSGRLRGRALGEVGEHDAHQQRDHDHDDQRRLAGAEDPADPDLFEVEDGEQRDQDRQHHERAGTSQLAPAAALGGPLLTPSVSARARTSADPTPLRLSERRSRGVAPLSGARPESRGSRSTDPRRRARRRR